MSEQAPTPGQVADRIRSVLGAGVHPAPRTVAPTSGQVADRIRTVLAKAPREVPTAPGVLLAPIRARAVSPARGPQTAARPSPRAAIPAWAAPAFPGLQVAPPPALAPAPGEPGASTSSGGARVLGAPPLVASFRLGESGRPSRAAARQAKATPAATTSTLWAHLTRRRSTQWWVSVVFHSFVLVSLGFFELAQRTDLVQRLFEPSSIAPPVHRVRLREAEPPRLDLDRAARAPRAIDLWNTPYDGPGGAERAGSELSDHDESADGEDYHQLKGGAFSIDGPLSTERGWGGTVHGATGVRNGAMGVGGGAGRARAGLLGAGQGGGARRGGRFGGRQNLVVRGGGSDATERAVGAGLRWLARHQNPDGSWGAKEYRLRCDKAHGCDRGGAFVDRGRSSVGLTGLAAIAFLDAGYDPGSKARVQDEVSLRSIAPGKVVGGALRWLCDHQDTDGGFRMEGGGIYDDAIATFALCEAVARTNAVIYRRAANRAVEYLERSRNNPGGWRYEAKDGDNDASATGWCVLALRAGQSATIDVDPETLRGARDYVESITDVTGWTHYQVAGMGGTRELGRLGNTPSSLLCRLFVDHSITDDVAANAIAILGEHRPAWSNADPHGNGSGVKGTNFYAWYYATLALYTIDGPDGPGWRAWNESLTKALLQGQIAAGQGCESGSWPYSQDYWASVGGGRVFATAINVLTLEVYYRYAPLFTLERR